VRSCRALLSIHCSHRCLPIDKIRLSDERKESEREIKELKDIAGPRVRKVDVEELRRKAARFGTL
jgi:hypothetical protein